jgi:alpha-tubulin suppressor-like RCC1 family protein
MGTPQSSKKEFDKFTPLPLPPNTKIAHISSGLNHTLILTSSGTVLSFGSGHFGQLGHGDDLSQATPLPIQGVKEELSRLNSLPDSPNYKATAVYAGGNHSLAVLSSPSSSLGDIVLCWGFNSSGQCGVGSFSNSENEPRRVVYFNGDKTMPLPPPLPASKGGAAPPPAPPPPTGKPPGATIVSASLSSSSTYLSTSRSTVYSMGSHKHGGLGLAATPALPAKFKGAKVRKSEQRSEIDMYW